MAGNYPDVPAWRIPWDKDGSQAFMVTGTTVTQVSSTVMSQMADDNPSNGQVPNTYVDFMVYFPILMDIDAWCTQWTWYNKTPAAIFTSADTTNGVDGTWNQVFTGGVSYTYSDKRHSRLEINSATYGAVRALKIGWTGTGAGNDYQFLSLLHLYGEPTAGQTLHRLQLWHPTLDQRVSAAWFDEGNVPRGSSGDIQFRVKNLSPTLTASAPRIAMEIASDGSPSVPGWHFIGKSGTFLAQQTIANLAPGAISSEVLTLRRTAPSNAALSLWEFRISCIASGGWA